MSSTRRLVAVLAAAGALRFLLSYTPLPHILIHRNELTTPLTSYERLQEGHYLSTSLHLNPYHAGSFHQAPLLLLLGPLTAPSAPVWLSHLLWTLVECVTAYLVGCIARGRTRKLSEGEKQWSGEVVALLYLLHPFSIGTALARSTIVFTNLFIALAVSSALEGAILPLAFSLSLAAHLSLYPALLLPPLILVAAQSKSTSSPASAPTPAADADSSSEVGEQQREKEKLKETAITAVGAFVGHQALVLGLSWWITGGSWAFFSSVYGVTLTLPDLTPTIGLGWYFFIEMFDHFRAFFVGVFQLHVLCYVAPVTYAYRKDPLFALLMLVGVIAIFKSYPELGDFALWHALLGTYSELGGYLSHPLFLLCLTLYSLFLLPTFHHLWLYSGQGNANFFYASTLVWTISQGGLLVDLMEARGRRGVLDALEKEGGAKGEVRRALREGRWTVVQR